MVRCNGGNTTIALAYNSATNKATAGADCYPHLTAAALPGFHIRLALDNEKLLSIKDLFRNRSLLSRGRGREAAATG